MLSPKVVFLDHNVWDFLLVRQLRLATELPVDRFSLWITREAEFAIEAIPNEKSKLRAFIEESFASSNVRTQAYFGFFDASFSSDEQRVAGFGNGWWIQPEELAFMERLRGKLGKLRKTRLYKNEADISLGARSLVATVLTLDRKRGPLRVAHSAGGDVLFLTDFDSIRKDLATFIEARSRRP